MKRLLALLLFLPTLAVAGSKPLVIISGQPQQLPAATTLQVNASSTGAAPINVGQGTAPSAPANGDVWITSVGLYARVAGSTVGPYSAGAGTGTVTSVTCGTGFTGGTFTTTGTCALDLTRANTWTGLQTLSVGANITPAATPATTAVGYLGAPLNEQDANYVFVMADAGATVRGSNGSGFTYTIPPTASVAYPIGTVIVVRNVGAGVMTLTRGSGVSLTIAGSGTSKDVAVAQYGLATLLLEASNTWVVTGVGVS